VEIFRRLPIVVLVAAAWCLAVAAQDQTPPFPSHPHFRPTPEVPAMPKALMKLPRTNITRAKFPAIDFHFHGRALQTAEHYQKLIEILDSTGIGVICNMDGGFGKSFDQAMQVGSPYRDRIIQFARVDFEGINEPGWSAKAAAELERCFRAGAAGLISLVILCIAICR
jgi:hypothetical protein